MALNGNGVTFQKATKKQAKLRFADEGPAGYGKTWTLLLLAKHLIEPGQRIAFVDTEGRSASKYAHRFDFDVIEMDPPFHPRRFVEAIHAAEAGGYGAIILDSLSHAWSGDGGTLAIVDDLAKNKYRGDSHSAWREGDAIQRELVDAILRSRIHVLASMRTKADYVREEVERDGRTRTVIRKAGTKTVQRDEFDYEFDVIGRFDTPTVMTVIKSRCDTLPPETIIKQPGAELAATLKAWLDDGAPVPEPPPAADKADIERVQGLIRAALQTPEDSEERGRLANAKAVLALAGYDTVTLGVIAKLSPEQLSVVERALAGEPAPAPTPTPDAVPA